MANNQVLTIGRIVHFVLDRGRHKGAHRAAIVTRVWSPTMVSLDVFTSGEDDGERSPLSVTSIKCDSDEKKPATWHWPEPEPEDGADRPAA